MEESATAPTEIVAETAVADDAAGHIAEIPLIPLADAVTPADEIASSLTILGAEIQLELSDNDLTGLPSGDESDDYVDGMSE